jgi:hypothetical protein
MQAFYRTSSAPLPKPAEKISAIDIDRKKIIKVPGGEFKLDSCIEIKKEGNVVNIEKLYSILREVAAALGITEKEKQERYIHFLIYHGLCRQSPPPHSAYEAARARLDKTFEPVKETDEKSDSLYPYPAGLSQPVLVLQADGAIVEHSSAYLTFPSEISADSDLPVPKYNNKENMPVNFRERLVIKPPKDEKSDQCEVVHQLQLADSLKQKFYWNKLQMQMVEQGFISAQEVILCYLQNPNNPENAAAFQAYIESTATAVKTAGGDANKLRQRFYDDISSLLLPETASEVLDKLINKVAKPHWRKAEEAKSVCFKDGSTIVGMHKHKGRDKAIAQKAGQCQEDEVVAFTLKGFKLLTNQQREQVLISTAAEMQKKFGQVPRKGSTMCGLIAWQEENKAFATVTSAGDGPVCCMVLDAAGNKVPDKNGKNLRLLNKLDNLPDIKDEKTGAVRKARLPDPQRPNDPRTGLAVTRAIGDTDYEKSGLKHEPRITHHEINVPAGGRAIFFGGSDHLTEKLSLQEIEDVVWENRNAPVDAIARRLDRASGEKGTGDDRSTIAFIATEQETGYFDFDGHGGANYLIDEVGNPVSRALGDNFYPALRACVPTLAQPLTCFTSAFNSIVQPKNLPFISAPYTKRRIECTAATLTEHARQLFVAGKDMKVHHDQLQRHVVDEILYPNETYVKELGALATRTAMMEKWVFVMGSCLKQKNYFTAQAISAALQSDAVQQLTEVRVNVSTEATTVLNQLNENSFTGRDGLIVSSSQDELEQMRRNQQVPKTQSQIFWDYETLRKVQAPSVTASMQMQCNKARAANESDRSFSGRYEQHRKTWYGSIPLIGWIFAGIAAACTAGSSNAAKELAKTIPTTGFVLPPPLLPANSLVKVGPQLRMAGSLVTARARSVSVPEVKANVSASTKSSSAPVSPGALPRGIPADTKAASISSSLQSSADTSPTSTPTGTVRFVGQPTSSTNTTPNSSQLPSPLLTSVAASAVVPVLVTAAEPPAPSVSASDRCAYPYPM